MRFFVYVLFGLLFCRAARAQDSIRNRIIFIGDAGEMDKEQQAVIPAASALILEGRTVVVYLGDNIYPRGMGLPGSPEEGTTKKILQSQYQPMRAKGAPVYFIPGNHDWDRMGRNGLAKIKRQWSYLEEQSDSLLKMVPRNGCPDPVEINISDALTMIAFDSEWWLFPFDKANPGADCDCKTKKDIVNAMQELFYRNRNKTILLADHHPFISYGTHGGYFSWKDHLFPLTALSNGLYIPLPVIGSLYPLLRTVFTSPEDLRDPQYRNMIRQVDGVFDGFPNLIHVAGHEHGLQFINNGRIQVISGAGAKQTFAKKGAYSLFAKATQGFVTADLLSNRTLRFTYYEYKTSGIVPVFHYDEPYLQPAIPPQWPAGPAMQDSVIVSVHAAYDRPGKFHRKLFGENYRKDWAVPTKLPMIRLSQFQGGLTPLQRGGGMQSNSLRLVDSSGREWVIRSVEKNVDLLLPEALRTTFARDFLDDVTSGQHPFSALVVPPIAAAVQVPHAHPIIGVIAPDKNLGSFEKSFANTVCLVEEREPLGKSDNTEKMMANLKKDNDNTVDGKAFLQARMLDLFLGDWDRHEDQWRWYDEHHGKGKTYLPVPRDRDQVFHVTQGLLPRLASKPYILPTLQNFGGHIESFKYSLIKTRFLNASTAMQFNYGDWMNQARTFSRELTDSVLETALRRLPAPDYQLRRQQLLTELKQRREEIPRAMDDYYRFINKIDDIRLSDKNEWVDIRDTAGGGLQILVSKLSKNGEVKGALMNKTFSASITREIRIYTGEGNDSVTIHSAHSPIQLRVIGAGDKKTYTVTAAARKIKLYAKPGESVFYGDSSRIQKHISTDPANSSFVPVNLYQVTMPLIDAGINADDGFLFGLGFLHTQQEGFRKTPYAHQEQLVVSHSFSTQAYHVKFREEWIKLVGRADFILQANIAAPDNTQNFFGSGNETALNKTGDYKRYYRARFNIYDFLPALRWGVKGRSTVSIGPALQVYHFDMDDNKGRFIEQPGFIHTYDSTNTASDKVHGGIVISFIRDGRDNKIMPTRGASLKLQLKVMTGLNSISKSFGQAAAELGFFKSINPQSTIIIADRIGGVATAGHPAFYQSAYIGGDGTLLGYRQFRFNGQFSLYNNLEARIKLTDFVNYILPGQFGLVGFFDLGRVWEKTDHSNLWHNGTGGGFYFAPAQMLVVEAVAGHSAEGWYPYITLGFRF